MAAQYGQPRRAWYGLWMLLVWLIGFCSPVRADNTRMISYATDDGTIYLDDNRRPALYTGDFGDCQGDSLIQVTRFDASLYRDNLTVMFHMEGTTALHNEKVMMFFSVFAYGESRFNLTFNPCVINIPSMCPLNASVPIEANGMIPIGPSDLAGIPSIAFSIPDFEGQAILRLFSNNTQSQIACYSAVMRNGNTFAYPAAVGSVLGVFTAVALLSSVAVTIYGQLVPETRTHYAHSISVFVVFSVLQHIFFTGSLSMNWPSVLVAFWSNYAWSAGMIYSKQMQNSISRFIGSDRGNISTVGSAASNQNFANLGGGYDLSQLYKRDTETPSLAPVYVRSGDHMFARRAIANSSTGFTWYGNPVAPGLPLPGNYSGFAGTLAQLNIPASNAFLTGLIWLLVLIGIVAAAMIITKWTTEVLFRMKMVKTGNLEFFRRHWVRFTIAAVMRTCFIAFFMIVYLTLFQFVLGGGKNIIALAGVVLAIFIAGMAGIASYAIWYRLHRSKLQVHNDKLQIVSHKHRFLNWYGVTRENSEKNSQTPQPTLMAFPWKHPRFVHEEGTQHVHDDETYTTKFGWLSSRFRRSKWWFFSAWLVYEFGRAGFYGGAAGHPLVQVFGLLAWEIIAFIAIVLVRPFESNRLNLLMVYFLGFSKVATVALSSAFDPRFGLSRILTTVIGVIIIVIQGVLTICLMLAIVLGVISSYMSISRNHQEFKPLAWTNLRIRYFAHIEQKATDRPRPPPANATPESSLPKEPYFAVSTVRREPKIEDEDPANEAVEDDVEESPEREGGEHNIYSPHNTSVTRVNSVRSRTSTSNLPYGARAHRRSWSVRDLPNQSTEQLPSGLHSRMSVESVRDAPLRYRAASMKDLSKTYGASTEDVESQPRQHRRTRSTSHQYGRSRRAAAAETNEIRPSFTRRVTEANETEFIESPPNVHQ